MSDTNNYPEDAAFKDLMTKVRSGTDQEVIQCLSTAFAPDTGLQGLSLIDALSITEEYEVRVGDIRGSDGEFPVGALAFDVLFCLVRVGKKESFDFLKSELSARRVEQVPILGTVYYMDWEELRNIDDADLRQQILDGKCEDLFPSSCQKFSGRPYRRETERPTRGASAYSAYDDSFNYDLGALEWDTLATGSDEIVLRVLPSMEEPGGLKDWITDYQSADPLDPPSLYGDRTLDTDKFTVVLKLDQRLA